MSRHVQLPEAAVTAPAPLQRGAGIGAFRCDELVRQLLRRSRGRSDPERAQGLGGEHHLTHNRQKWCCTAEATPLRRALIPITPQHERFTAAPDPCHGLKLIHRQTQLTAERPHSPGQHVADTWPTRQTAHHAASQGIELVQHLPHPTSTTDAHRLIRRVPADLGHGAAQIQGPLTSRCSPGAGAPAADAQRPGTTPSPNKARQILWGGLQQAPRPGSCCLGIEQGTNELIHSAATDRVRSLRTVARPLGRIPKRPTRRPDLRPWQPQPTGSRGIRPDGGSPATKAGTDAGGTWLSGVRPPDPAGWP